MPDAEYQAYNDCGDDVVDELNRNLRHEKKRCEELGNSVQSTSWFHMSNESYEKSCSLFATGMLCAKQQSEIRESAGRVAVGLNGFLQSLFSFFMTT